MKSSPSSPFNVSLPGPPVIVSVAGPTGHEVVAGPAGHVVVAGLAVGFVVSEPGDDPVVTLAAVENVVLGAAVDDIVAVTTSRTVSPSAAPVRGCHDRRHRRACPSPMPPSEAVTARSAVEHVVARAAPLMLSLPSSP